MAYRLLARNQPVPQNIGMAAQGKRTDLPNAPQPDHQQLYPPQGAQNFQRPPTPGAPLVPMQSQIRPQGPGYPAQQPITSSSSIQQSSAMGPPLSTGAPTQGSTASPVPGTIPSSAPRPPQTQV